jgi:putative MATE family efflux protein
MQNQSVLDDNRIGRLLLKLSIPAFIGLAVMTLYNVIDTIFISYYVGPLGIAGLSIVFPLQMLAVGIGQMTGMGGASQISRLIGARNVPRAERVLGNAISLTLVASIVILVIGQINTDFWLRLMGASETVLPYARDYMKIILFGMIFQTLSMSMAVLAISEGGARISMIGHIIGAVLNIILCAVFVAVLGMGVRGSALATVIAQLISTGYYMSHFIRGKSFLRMHLNNLVMEWVIVKDIMAIGVASFTRLLAESLPIVFINRGLSVYGDLAVSTFGILNRVLMFAIMPGIVIGQGLQPILGFNCGARRYDKALKSIQIAVIASSICSLIVFVVLYFFPQPVIRIFTADAEIIELSSTAAKKIFLAIYLVGFLMVGSTIFQALGKARPSFITAIARSAVFLIPLVLILPHYWEQDGIWFSFPITDALSCLLTAALFIPQIRSLQKMKRAAEAKIPADMAVFKSGNRNPEIPR